LGGAYRAGKKEEIIRDMFLESENRGQEKTKKSVRGDYCAQARKKGKNVFWYYTVKNL